MAQEKQMKKVNWQARVALPGDVDLKLRAKSVSGRTVTVQSEIPLPKGTACELTMSAQGEGTVKAACRVGDSVLSAADYLVWLDVVACHEGERWLRA